MIPSSTLPAGFVTGRQVERTNGGFRLAIRREPPALWVAPRGAAGPSLAREGLAFAAQFGAAHPEGWTYVVDASALRAVRPSHFSWLRAARRLPNLRRYVVVAPSLLVRIMVFLAKWVVRCDVVVRDPGSWS